MIFFDIDDTLFDYNASETVAARAFARENPELASSEDDFAATWALVTQTHMRRYLTGEISFQQQRRERIKEVFGRSMDDAEADRLFSVYHDFFKASWQLFPEVEAALSLLVGQRLGIITNGDPEQQDGKLRFLKIRDHFEFIVTPQDVNAAKPLPDIFRHAAERACVDPCACWYVGDHYENDYLAAAEVGFRPVLVDRDQAMPGLSFAYTDLAKACLEISRAL